MSQAELGSLVGIGRSTIGAYETAKRRPEIRDVEALDEHLKARGSLMRAWEEARRSGRGPAWYRQVTDAERHASEIHMFHSAVVPGRFQVAEYARAVLAASRPLDSAEEIEKIVQLRLKVLAHITDGTSPRQSLILPESVIRASVGGADVMCAQLTHLVKLVQAGVIQLSVLPSGAPTLAGLGGPFRLIIAGDGTVLVYAEHAVGGVLVDDVVEVRRMAALFHDLHAWCLDPAASMALVENVRGEP